MTGPWSTSATRTATEPATVAPTIGMNAPRKTSTPIGEHERHPEDRGHDHDADRVGERHDHGGPHELGQRDPGDPARAVDARRAARGERRTTQAQIRSPSARKKYVENSTMKKPARTWPSAVPTSVTRVRIAPLVGCSVIASWACSM